MGSQRASPLIRKRTNDTYATCTTAYLTQTPTGESKEDQPSVARITHRKLHTSAAREAIMKAHTSAASGTIDKAMIGGAGIAEVMME